MKPDSELRVQSNGPAGRRTLAFILLSSALCAMAWEMRTVLPPCDDAYISFRYARNLVNGHGLVYNIGERVEGFTNLLWTLLIALEMRLGFEPRMGVHALAAASEALLLVLSYVYARGRLSPQWAALAGLAPWVVISSGTYAMWGPSGLETPLFAALTLATLLAAERARPAITLCCALLVTLTRPEGAIVSAVALGQFAVIREGSWLKRLAPGALYAVGLAVMTLARVAYYGVPFPNTFYAKVGGIPISHGLAYVRHFFEVGPAILLWPATFAVADRRTRWSAVFVVVFTAYVISIGGDAFEEGRFLLPVLPVLTGMCLCGIEQAWNADFRVGLLFATSLPSVLLCHMFGSPAAPAVTMLTGSAFAFLCLTRPIAWRNSVAGALFAVVALVTVLRNSAAPRHGVPQAPTNQSRAELVDFAINEHRWVEGTGGHFAEVVMAMQPKVKLVAMVGIGVTGYALGNIAVLDMVGLIDPVIARSRKVIPNTLILPGHQRSDADYVLRRRPDVIAAGGSGLVLPATRELLDHPAFRTDYEEIPDMPGVYRLRRALITARTPP